MKTAKIVKVYEVATHAYDDTQRESAYRVLLSSGRRCWLVAYGADYLPAGKDDLANIYDRIAVPIADDGSEAWGRANKQIGRIVHAYRNPLTEVER